MKIDKDYIKEVKENLLVGQLPIPDNLTRATQGLFYEFRHSTNSTPYYNLGEFDANNTLSMYQIYMQCPSEYDAALVLLGSLNHWNKLCNTKWFQPHIEKWREAMAIRDAAIGQSTIFTKALQGDVNASKQLLSNQTVKAKPKAKEGSKARPNLKVHEEDVHRFLEAGAEAINESRNGNDV